MGLVITVSAFWRKVMSLAYDILASAVAFALGFQFAVSRDLNFVAPSDTAAFVTYTAVFVAIAIPVIYFSRLYRSIWRYSSFEDFLNVLRATTITVAIFLPFAFLATRTDALPRSAPFIAWFLMVAFTGAPRLAWRMWVGKLTPRPLLTKGVPRDAAQAVPILLVGDMQRAEPFLRELARRREAPYYVTGILTQDRSQHAHVIHGVPVLGAPGDITAAMTYLRQRNLRPQRLVLADDAADETVVSQYLEYATRNGLTLGRLPRLTDIDSKADGNSVAVRSVAIADLLGRPQTVLDQDAMRTMLSGRCVLITGAGGSIGSELARQIAGLGPKKLVLLDNAEFNLYAIEKEIGESYPELIRQDALCDVRDRAGVNRWFLRERPDVVFHAAALKHVPLVESHPMEGVRTNVLGTQNVADACAQFGVANMVLISTDKAVNPHNVMGASKRCAEAYCQAMDALGGTTHVTIVRFGNVLGSTGSVIPLFQRQLDKGGPLTVTHPDITRYFMTIPEAVALVLQAAVASAKNPAKRGMVHVLDMGKPIRIVDLARQMIRLSGKRPDIDIKIEFVGLRPGEKLYEELVHDEEQQDETDMRGVILVSPRTVPLPILRNLMSDMGKAVEHFDQDRLFRLLKVVVPEFAGKMPQSEMQPPAAGE